MEQKEHEFQSQKKQSSGALPTHLSRVFLFFFCIHFFIKKTLSVTSTPERHRREHVRNAAGTETRPWQLPGDGQSLSPGKRQNGKGESSPEEKAREGLIPTRARGEKGHDT